MHIFKFGKTANNFGEKFTSGGALERFSARDTELEATPLYVRIIVLFSNTAVFSLKPVSQTTEKILRKYRADLLYIFSVFFL